MRSSRLDSLFASAAALPGIGPQTAKMLDRLLERPVGTTRVVDLLFHMPSGAIDRRHRPKIADAPFDAVVTLEVRVTEHRMPPPRSRTPARILVEDETGDVQLVFFLANPAWVERALPLGATRWISGKLELWEGHRQMVHPTHVLDAEGFARLPAVEPTYPLTEGLSPKVLGKAIASALTRVPDLPDWLPPHLPFRHRPTFAAALEAAHRPPEPSDIGPESAARKRLAFDELFANQMALLLMRREMRRLPGRPNGGDQSLADKIVAALPFALTGAQFQALVEIRGDLVAPMRMLRLLQGDVGSGKTIVALLAMADVVAAGHQTALMAPTEILARQHLATLERFGAPAGLRIALLTGRDTAAARRGTLEALATGTIDILVGTHAIFQEPVAFKDLAFAVVDEQHKFGVHQRLALGAKGEAVDMLVMTATPIPRTLVLTYFGDMDASTLRDKPVGRLPIETAVISAERIGAVIDRLQAALATGVRAYWLCPLVEESETSDLAAADERAADLRHTFGDAVGLVHGRMKGREKDAAMAAFKAGETRLLVATTVVEVGVDVPEATIMVIEHAERFGLAQLHQLRGRVGRGADKSYCILLYKGPLGAVAKARLDVLRESEDGFRIAEEDLKLRGEGEVLGTRQSGLPGFHLADLAVHADLLPLARDAAEKMLGANPGLEGEDGAAVRLLLHLFGRDEAIKLLRAG